MRTKHLLAFILLLLSATIARAAGPHPQMRQYSCPGPNVWRTHVGLLEHAILADFTYKKNSGMKKWNLHKICPAGINAKAPDSQVKVEPIPDWILDLAKDNVQRENDNRTVDDHIGESTGDKFVTCTTNRTLKERLAVAFRYVRRNENLSLFAKVAIVGISGLETTEEIKVVTLQDDSDGASFGIKGTDMSRIKEWNTSIQNLIMNSCIFDFAVEVSTIFFESGISGEIPEFRARNYGLVGHSLGGAVAQHVAQEMDLMTVIQKHQENAVFRAHSFNSIGVDVGGPESAERVERRKFVTSVRVAGDFLEELQQQVGRVQIGHLYRYGSSQEKFSLPDRI